MDLVVKRGKLAAILSRISAQRRSDRNFVCHVVHVGVAADQLEIDRGRHFRQIRSIRVYEPIGSVKLNGHGQRRTEIEAIEAERKLIGGT